MAALFQPLLFSIRFILSTYQFQFLLGWVSCYSFTQFIWFCLSCKSVLWPAWHLRLTGHRGCRLKWIAFLIIVRTRTCDQWSSTSECAEQSFRVFQSPLSAFGWNSFKFLSKLSNLFLSIPAARRLPWYWQQYHTSTYARSSLVLRCGVLYSGQWMPLRKKNSV